ncbi:MAG TPA: response regulator transcription factor [Candidatus Limnocylindrales bacterium]|nr:response regulator transcription factor [Candidatus Limnocylindrales bacterium]
MMIRIETSTRLLLIEDDELIAALITRALQTQGCRIEHAVTGPRGLQAAVCGQFDLVILDLLLPGMDGTLVLRKLMELLPQQRVLVLSAVSDVATKVACLEAGAVDFLGKPFELAELIARVRIRLRLPAPGPAAGEIVIGPVKLDLSLQTVVAAGRRTALSYREFVLLRHFMSRAGRPCTRGELLRDVWSTEFDPGSNVVEVYVRRLRGKLDRPNRIETVRHVGYRFNAD